MILVREKQLNWKATLKAQEIQNINSNHVLGINQEIIVLQDKLMLWVTKKDEGIEKE